MTEDAFDEMLDDATHAVNNLLPDGALDAMTPDERSDVLVRINDALAPILRDAVQAVA